MNFTKKLFMLIAFSSATTSILPLTFFDDGSIVHRGGRYEDGDSRHHDHFWNKDHKKSKKKNNTRKSNEKHKRK